MIRESASTIGERIRLLLFRHDMTQAGLAQKVGVSQSAISQMISGKNHPSSDLIAAISREFDVNINWLLLGEGAMYKSEMGGGLKAVTVDSAGRPNIVLVPVKAQAGYALERLQPEYLSELPAFQLPLARLRQGEYRAFEIDGDSMEPTLMPGDVVVCSALEDPRWVRDRALYVFVLDDDVLVKRAFKNHSRPDRLTLVSDNEYYPPYEFAYAELREVWRVEARITFDLPTPASAKKRSV